MPPRRGWTTVLGTLVLLTFLIPASPASIRDAAGKVPGQAIPWMVGTVPKDWMIVVSDSETAVPLVNVADGKFTVAIFAARECTASGQMLRELTTKLDQIQRHARIVVIWDSERNAKIARVSTELGQLHHFSLVEPTMQLQLYPMIWILNDRGEVVFDRRGMGDQLWGTVLDIMHADA